MASDYSALLKEFNSFGKMTQQKINVGTPDEEIVYNFEGGAAQNFAVACRRAKVDVDDILAGLIIVDDSRGLTVPETEKKDRMEDYLGSLGIGFDPTKSRTEKIDCVMKNLSMAQKIAVLSEVQALESLVEGSNPYPQDVYKLRKQKSDAKKACIAKGRALQKKYAEFLEKLDSTISSKKAKIVSLNEEITRLSAGVAAENAPAKVTTEAAARITSLQASVEAAKKELSKLISLQSRAAGQAEQFYDAIDASLRDNKLFEEDKAKEEDKKSSSTPAGGSISSPYSSLSERGKQASDSEEARDLYQSFASADTHNKFLMITGLDAHNMMEIARNLDKVGDRKDLQEYCEKLIDSKLLKDLEAFDLTIDGETYHLPGLSKAKLKEGLLEYDIDKIKGLYEVLHTLKLQDIKPADLKKLQNYSNGLLISTVLQEAKWGLGKQITKGFLKFPGRKKTSNYDLGNDVASFMRPLCERKDRIFKEINKEVDKGIDTADHTKYGPSTAVQHGKRKFQVRTFDER